MELEFWKDQKSTRNIVIGNTDKGENVKIRKREERNLKATTSKAGSSLNVVESFISDEDKTDDSV